MNPYEVPYPDNIVDQGTNFIVYFGWIVSGLVFLIILGIIWYCRNKIKDYKAMMMTGFLLFALPLGVLVTLQETNLQTYALSKILISKVEIEAISPTEIKVILVTNRPAIALIETKSEDPLIFPDNGTEFKLVHEFTIDSKYSEFAFIVNGIRFEKW